MNSETRANALEASLRESETQEQRQFEAWVAMRTRAEKAEAEVKGWRKIQETLQVENADQRRRAEKAEKERDALKVRLKWSEGQWMEEYDALKARVASHHSALGVVQGGPCGYCNSGGREREARR
mgnify:CR=1 FL=1